MPRTKQQHLTWFWVLLLVGIFSAARHKHCHGAVIVSNTLRDNAPESGIQYFITIAFECVTIYRFIGWYVREIAPVISACPEHICVENPLYLSRVFQQPFNQNAEKFLKIQPCSKYIVIQLLSGCPRYHQRQHRYVIALQCSIPSPWSRDEVVEGCRVPQISALRFVSRPNCIVIRPCKPPQNPIIGIGESAL